MEPFITINSLIIGKIKLHIKYILKYLQYRKKSNIGRKKQDMKHKIKLENIMCVFIILCPTDIHNA